MKNEIDKDKTDRVRQRYRQKKKKNGIEPPSEQIFNYSVFVPFFNLKENIDEAENIDDVLRLNGVKGFYSSLKV